MSNLVSNAGVVATDTTGVGTVRSFPGATGYGVDKVIFAYGLTTGGSKLMSIPISVCQS